MADLGAPVTSQEEILEATFSIPVGPILPAKTTIHSPTKGRALGVGGKPLITPEQAAKDPLSPISPPSSPRTGSGGTRRGCQALVVVLFLVAAFTVAALLTASHPAGGGSGGGFSGYTAGSSSSAAGAQPSCAAAAADVDVAALAPPLWRDTVAVFMDAVREAAEVKPRSGGEGGVAGAEGAMMSGPRKGPVLMLVTGNAGDARHRARVVSDTFGACQRERCVLTVDCDEAAATLRDGVSSPAAAEQEARGRLQKVLVSFLWRCPRGVVVFAGAESLSPPLLSALIPALSEGGRYMYDGGEVRADLATYVVTVALDGASRDGIRAGAGDAGRGRSPGSWWESERTFARRAKDALVTSYGGVAASDDGVVGSFRRRIDFVAPFR